MSAEVITAWRCLECEAVSEESAGSLYECSRCGEVFTQESSADGGSNRCPTDNIFGAKIADDACPECNAGEVEQVQAVEIDGELVVVEGDGDPDSLIAQAHEKREQEKREQQELENAKARKLEEALAELNALPRVRAADVKPGDTLAYHDPNRTWAWEPVRTFKVARVEPTGDGEIRFAPSGGIGFHFVCKPDDVFALAERPEVTPENEPSLEEKIRAAGLDKPVSYMPKDE